MPSSTKKYIELTCSATGETFLKEKKEYNRQIKEGVTRFFKNRYVANAFLRSEHKVKNELKKECPLCHQMFESTRNKRSNQYCSRKCASVHRQILLRADPFRAQQRGAKISQKVKCARQEGKYRPPMSPETRRCVTCNAPYSVLPYIPKQTCSDKCFRELLRKNSSANPNCGGENYSRKTWYKGVSMDSSWEVKVAEWLDAHDIRWVRDRKMCLIWIDEKGNPRRYHPDFFLPDWGVYVEPKNQHLIEKDRFKIEQVVKIHKIRLIWGLLPHVLEELEKLIQPVSTSQ